MVDNLINSSILRNSAAHVCDLVQTFYYIVWKLVIQRCSSRCVFGLATSWLLIWVTEMLGDWQGANWLGGQNAWMTRHDGYPFFFCFLLATHFFICYNFLYSPRKGRKGLGIGGIWSGYHGGALRHWGIETLRHFLFFFSLFFFFSFFFLLLFSPPFFSYFLLAFHLPLETPGTKSPTKHLK